jgi:membrane associated rhomboid family serine protease
VGSTSQSGGAYTAAMPSSRVMRVFLGLVVLNSVINVITVVRDPDALRFLGVVLVAAAVVGAVGSVVALILVAARRLSAAERNSLVERIRT